MIESLAGDRNRSPGTIASCLDRGWQGRTGSDIFQNPISSYLAANNAALVLLSSAGNTALQPTITSPTNVIPLLYHSA